MRCLVAILLLAASAASAEAAIITGEITGGSVLRKNGEFIELRPQQLGSGQWITIGKDNFNDPNLYAFNEWQNIKLLEDISLDIGGTLKAGTTVAAHYIVFDPVRDNTKGWIQFDAPILGIATSNKVLAATDYLANSKVNYLQVSARGLEKNDMMKIDPNDLTRLFFDLTASSPGDFVRVFTARSPMSAPLPPALWAFAAGLAAFGGLSRRRGSRMSKKTRP